MKKRHTFQCWNCGKTYTLFRDFIVGQKMLVACPFCGEDGLVDLAPYRDTETTVYRGIADDEAETRLEGLTLPEVLPTAPRAAEDR